MNGSRDLPEVLQPDDTPPEVSQNKGVTVLLLDDDDNAYLVKGPPEKSISVNNKTFYLYRLKNIDTNQSLLEVLELDS